MSDDGPALAHDSVYTVVLSAVVGTFIVSVTFLVAMMAYAAVTEPMTVFPPILFIALSITAGYVALTMVDEHTDVEVFADE